MRVSNLTCCMRVYHGANIIIRNVGNNALNLRMTAVITQHIEHYLNLLALSYVTSYRFQYLL
jgi:hypothetical protein